MLSSFGACPIIQSVWLTIQVLGIIILILGIAALAAHLYRLAGKPKIPRRIIVGVTVAVCLVGICVVAVMEFNSYQQATQRAEQESYGRRVAQVRAMVGDYMAANVTAPREDVVIYTPSFSSQNGTWSGYAAVLNRRESKWREFSWQLNEKSGLISFSSADFSGSGQPKTNPFR